MSNVRNFFGTLFHAARQATLDGRFEEADDICHRLLGDPTLPLFCRAGCNLMLSFGDDNRVEYAREAVDWYEHMYNEVRDHPVDGPHHLALLNQARDALTRAEREAAEQDDESHEDEDAENREEDTGSETEVVLETDIESGAEASLQASSPPAAPSSSLGGETLVGTASTQASAQEDDAATTEEE